MHGGHLLRSTSTIVTCRHLSEVCKGLWNLIPKTSPQGFSLPTSIY